MPNPDLRAELEAFAAEHGAGALHARLKALDPPPPINTSNNIRRVVRALEVCLEAERPISALQRKRPPDYAILHYGLTLERDRLYARADQRVEEMVKEGFVDEVRRLLEMGYSRDLPSMSGLGYRNWQPTSWTVCLYPAPSKRLKTRLMIHPAAVYLVQGHDQGILWQNIEKLDKDVMSTPAHSG